MDSEIWLVHAGCGKTTAAQMRSDVLDMTVGYYKFLHPIEDCNQREVERIKGTMSEINPEWPWNYIEALVAEKQKGDYRYILAPVIQWVAYSFENGLDEMSPVPYTLVYPDISLKEKYRKRYIERGNTERFLDIFVNNGQWEGWISDFELLQPTCRIILGAGQYLLDVLG